MHILLLKSHVSASEVRTARRELGLGVRELAALADVSTASIRRLERGMALKAVTARAIQAALERAIISSSPEMASVLEYG